MYKQNSKSRPKKKKGTPFIPQMLLVVKDFCTSQISAVYYTRIYPKNAIFLKIWCKRKDPGRIRTKLGTTVVTSAKASQFFRTWDIWKSLLWTRIQDFNKEKQPRIATHPWKRKLCGQMLQHFTTSSQAIDNKTPNMQPIIKAWQLKTCLSWSFQTRRYPALRSSILSLDLGQ